MPILKTTNALTAAHGYSPLAERSFAEKGFFERGWVVYIEMRTDALLRVRQFYQNFDPEKSSLEQQKTFENDVIAMSKGEDYDSADSIPAKKGFDLSLVNQGDPINKKPFSLETPYAFYDNLDRVDFGWRPCHVTYILSNEAYAFMEPDGQNPELGPNQPIVFRSTKVVEEKPGKYLEAEFLPNYTFFNENVDNVSAEAISFLRFDNFMLDEKGKQIKRVGREKDRKWDYCIDIYVRVPLLRFKKYAKLAEGLPGNTYPERSLMIVFDPPHTGGGGQGGEP
jgi:hypothetical protein